MKQYSGKESSNPLPKKQVHGQYTNVGKTYAPPAKNHGGIDSIKQKPGVHDSLKKPKGR